MKRLHGPIDDISLDLRVILLSSPLSQVDFAYVLGHAVRSCENGETALIGTLDVEFFDMDGEMLPC